jgi:hypothetical protein
MLRDLKASSLVALDDIYAPEIETDMVKSEPRQTFVSIVDLEDACWIETCFGEKTKISQNNFFGNSKYQKYDQKKKYFLNYPEDLSDDDSMINFEDEAKSETDVDEPDEESHTIV